MGETPARSQQLIYITALSTLLREALDRYEGDAPEPSMRPLPGHTRRRDGRHELVRADFNIAAEPIDVARPTHPTGFLPSEREAFAALLELGLADCFRAFHPGEPGHYTWWENWPGGRERNLGWRIDYLLASPLLAQELQACRHEREPRLSDHCAVAGEFAGPAP